jgi:hypothetical protein
MDPFELNIAGGKNLISSGINKTYVDDIDNPVGEPTDLLELNMSESELILLATEWRSKHEKYYPKIKPRQERNKLYYSGLQRNNDNTGKVVSSNLIFEAQETFIPQALSKNPEPVVWSDNTEEGKEASNQIKTMLQFKADSMCLRKKLGIMLRQWSTYFIGVVKYGWDDEINDFKIELRKPQNFILDPDGYIDEFGKYCGNFLGEKIQVTAEKLAEMFPKHKAYITIKVNGKMGTMCTYVEWWTDKYSFSTFEDIVLDKHKNPFFNYPTTEKASEEEIEAGLESETTTPGQNHFAKPEMPYTFLSVFSLQEQPHDITNLIEQNIPNQDDINDQDTQVSRNLRNGNNSIAFSGLSFNKENASEAARALEDGDPVLVPDGQVDSAIKRLPASSLPPGLLDSLQLKKDTLRSVFGTQGLTATAQDDNQTARGMILNKNQDSTRIGGGIGDALEQVADNIFNWMLQLMYVFYDEEHYAAVMGTGRAVEYTSIIKTNINRQFVISVAPGSMKPKDEISEMNMAIDLWSKQALDPITLFKKLDYPDPMETAKQVALWVTNPQAYMLQYFPENQPQPVDSANPPNAVDLNTIPPTQDETLSASPSSASLSQVPINTP